MNDRRFARVASLLATLSVVALVVEPMVASAQSAPNGYDQNGYDQNGVPPPGEPSGDTWADAPAPGYQYAQSAPPGEQGPPPAQYADPRDNQYGPPPAGQYGSPPPQPYAPPPRGEYASPPQAAGGQGYNGGYYQPSHGDEQARHDQWAARNCISQRNNNTAAGAIFGGAAGALLGFSFAGWAARGAWALFGGTMGATLGAALGSSANTCSNDYASAGAPPYGGGAAYAYAGPAYGPGPAPYAPAYSPAGPAYRSAPHGPWMWTGERWVHRPYRSGYGPRGYRPAGYPNYRY